ncbi:sodium:proton antiporter [Sphingomonas sp. Leaf339]|uniref:Na+/H+ antiporter NhaA n=1 Tax=Sphingomonas sp. Leaf339 TaxID=1736343 RepID=UPI0007003DE7|nr:Na+/H+ antiporter NhaA [Sphingomonas sp. Leaf339]KQU61621.1 sodium:proton antiporter [Sphingomonas sp. Leaf339]
MNNRLLSKRAIASGFRRCIHEEASGGIVLMAAAVAAILVANSPLAAEYEHLLHVSVGGMGVLHWINDGLMALFFLMIGLEVKREMIAGHLASWDRRVLPGVAALAGMVVPALVYLGINGGDPANWRGWAIPAATDIAFALGILALLGSRIPVSLKILLTAIAVIDDLLAIVVIALFYTGQIALLPLLAASAGVALLMVLNRFGVRTLWPYMLIGVGIWYGVLLSGVHATLAGVAVALTIPMKEVAASESPLDRLARRLHPGITFLIVPIFGFANAGVSFAGMTIHDAVAPLPLGIAAGLLIGKQLGIFTAIVAMVRLGWADMPMGANWRQVHGMAVLCGIGFTMSLFIGGLAFADAGDAMGAVKLGVFAGSLLAGGAGYLLLRQAPMANAEPRRSA